MQLLKSKAAKLGVPNINGEDAMADKAIPVLHFGSTRMNNNFTLVDEVQKLDRGLITLLPSFLRDHPLIVIGYRGAEPSIMHHLLLDQCATTNDFRQGVYWCTLSQNEDDLHPLVKQFRGRIGSNFQAVHISGFDDLMRILAETCASLPRSRCSGRRSSRWTACCTM